VNSIVMGMESNINATVSEDGTQTKRITNQVIDKPETEEEPHRE
jgi:hypothetical protein